jgi:ABC-type dipeptide/oligopeptide/nickel transport system permease subunit
MPDVFWIGLSVAALSVLIGLVAGAKSRTTSTLTGLTMGCYLGVMFAFPLLALGLATS